MGPIAANSVALYQGPGYGYPASGSAQPLKTYVIDCFSAPAVPPGASGPFAISDMSTVWYVLADPATPTQGIGYIQAANPANQFSTTSANILDQAGPCPSVPPPPAPAPGAPVISAQPPQTCPHGILNAGSNTIQVEAPSGQLDIKFTAASLPVPVDVKDLSTGQDGSGVALSDQAATWHFTENQGAPDSEHVLSITTDDGFGGPTGEEGPVNADGTASDVGWEALSGNCTP
jgi:hypothetical protein